MGIMEYTFSVTIVILVLAISLYVWHMNRAMSRTPPEAEQCLSDRWTKRDILNAYKRTLESPTDVKKFLPPKTGRRYIVTGGSGFVGSWIVRHLLLRGEDPTAIRIIDLLAPTHSEALENGVEFIKTDISDREATLKAFTAPWSNKKIAALPLTVFHTVAFINAAQRTKYFLPKFMKVNVHGTQNAVDASKAAGASCLIATSSGSIAIKSTQYFISPFQRWGKNIFQVHPNAEPRDLDGPLEAFVSCYPFSKARAERLVRNADDKTKDFRTGCIRPAHVIYGHHNSNHTNILYHYLDVGGVPVWGFNTLTIFVNVQNVSIAHLAYEERLVSAAPSAKDVGGRAYCCLDPSGPIRWGEFLDLMSTLAHPSTPMKFPPVPAGPLLLMSYLIEYYALCRVRFLKFLPEIRGNMSLMMPAIFQMSCPHNLYDDKLAKEEIGYRPPIETLEGMCLGMIEWNEQAAKKVNGKTND